MLTALLWCRISVDDARERAPWITDGELRKLQSAADELKRNQLGEMINLTWDERIGHRVYFLTACDVTQEESNKRQAERNRENARNRQIKYREARTKMRHTAKRDDAMLRMLTMLPPIPHSGGFDPMSGWTSVSALVKEAAHCNAFRRPDGRPLRNLRDAVHAVLRTLKAHGQIEITEQPGARGMVLLVRRADLEAGENDAERYAFSDGRSVVGENRAETLEYQDTYTESGAVTLVSTQNADSDAPISLNEWRRRKEAWQDLTFPFLAWSNPVDVPASAKRQFRCEEISDDNEMAMAA